MVNKDTPMTQYKLKHLVYLIAPQTYLPKSISRKIRVIFMEPPVVKQYNR